MKDSFEKMFGNPFERLNKTLEEVSVTISEIRIEIIKPQIYIDIMVNFNGLYIGICNIAVDKTECGYFSISMPIAEIGRDKKKCVWFDHQLERKVKQLLLEQLQDCSILEGFFTHYDEVDVVEFESLHVDSVGYVR